MTRARCIHAASERDADMLFACGMLVTDPVLWFQVGWRQYLVVSPLEVDRAKKQSSAHHVIDQRAFGRKMARELDRVPTRLEIYSAILRSKGVKRVDVPARFPLETAEAFRAAGMKVTSHAPPYFPERMFKTPEQVAHIETAQHAGERSLDAALDVLRGARRRNGVLRHKGDTVTSESLRGVIGVELMRHGCFAVHTIVASGEQGADPHDVGSGPIRPDTPIIFDIFPRHTTSGYFADMTRTVVWGKPSRDVREIYDLVHRGQQYGFDHIHAGCQTQPIHRGIVELFASEGRPTGHIDGRHQGYFHGTGHGVGLDIHEPPSFGDMPDQLPEGAVVTVEPGLYYAGIGGVRLEDMVQVTKDGCVNLTKYEKSLEL